MRLPNAPAREGITRRRLPDPLPRLLRDAREAAGLSQREAADRAGISQPFLARLEGGERSLSRETAGRLAAALGLAVRDRGALEAVARPYRRRREWARTARRASWRAYRAAELRARRLAARARRDPKRRQRFTRR